MAGAMQGRSARRGRGFVAMRQRVAFDRPDQVASTGLNGKTRVWTEIRTCRAEVIYMRGSEAVEAARLQGRAVFKLRIRKMGTALDIDTGYRMRTLHHGLPGGAGEADPLPGTRYDVREVDALSDRRWIYLVVESSLS